MPMVKAILSVELNNATKQQLYRQLATDIAKTLGKPEKYMMITVKDNQEIFFDGSTEPAAYLEIKSIGQMTASQTKELSKTVCLALKDVGIAPERVYIEFNDSKAYLWGYNGDTF
jgi:phenylpyruvate tautomerase PptA (4-oxalocrotonate tautomerase family)